MAPTKLIAGLMGPLLLAIGAALLLNRELFPAMAAQFAQNYGVVFIAGIMAFVAGVAIVRVHNVWTGGWPVIVTVLGWLAIVGGLGRMWFPQLAAPIAESVTRSSSVLLLAGAVVLALGGYLTFKSYSSS
jgi:hypothetical protein